MASIPRPASQPLLDAALAYAARNLRIFPLIPRDKKPLIKDWPNEATTDETQIRQWWRTWRNANIGLLTGQANNWLAIDVDTKNGATYDHLAALAPAGHKLTATMMAQTATGGLHLVFRYPRNGVEIRNSASKIAHGIDVRGEGGFIVVAPSVTPAGQYEWMNDLEPAPLPTWLLKLLTAQPEPTPIRKPATPTAATQDSDAYWLSQAFEHISQGATRNDTGLWLACQLRDSGLSEGETETVLLEYAEMVRHDGQHAYTDSEARATARSAYSRPAREPAKSRTRAAARPKAEAARPLPAERPALRALPPIPPGDDDDGPEAEQPAERRKYHRTEMGNAERLLDSYGVQLRYTKAAGYVAWDGKRWKAGAELQAETWAKTVIRDLYREAADLAGEASRCESEGERELLAAESADLMKWAMSSEKAKMVSAMLMLARSACAVDLSQFDSEPWLFNCQNGTLDLRTGELREHRRSDHLMQISPVTYDPQAQCPRWLQFLREIMLDDGEMVSYLQRVVGHALTGDVSEQEWYLLVGEGENGKSVLMETLSAVMGEYAHMMAPETITITGQPRRGQEASPDIAMLKGKRFVRVTETAEGARIDAARVKSLTGGDEIPARFLHKDLFTFRPTAKMFVYTNHRPETRETTHAFWRRVRYVPFEFNLREHPELKDEKLPAKLLAELPGILAWAVAGCLAWQRDGLNPPQRVLEATKAYQRDSDVLRDFIESRCLVRFDCEVRANALYAAYVEWCKETGEHQQNMRRFGKAITERGFERKTNNGVVYVGIGLRAEIEQTTLTI